MHKMQQKNNSEDEKREMAPKYKHFWSISFSKINLKIHFIKLIFSYICIYTHIYIYVCMYIYVCVFQSN